MSWGYRSPRIPQEHRSSESATGAADDGTPLVGAPDPARAQRTGPLCGGRGSCCAVPRARIAERWLGGSLSRQPSLANGANGSSAASWRGSSTSRDRERPRTIADEVEGVVRRTVEPTLRGGTGVPRRWPKHHGPQRHGHQPDLSGLRPARPVFLASTFASPRPTRSHCTWWSAALPGWTTTQLQRGVHRSVRERVVASQEYIGVHNERDVLCVWVTNRLQDPGPHCPRRPAYRSSPHLTPYAAPEPPLREASR